MTTADALPTTAAAHPSPAAAPATRSRAALWGGRFLTGFATLFLTFDALIKFSLSKEAVQGTTELGWPVELVGTLGALQLVLLAISLVPRTAVLGAVLWTGYLGGAIATHLRLENPLLTHTLFPLFVAALLWGGLYLRDARVRALLRASR